MSSTSTRTALEPLRALRYDGSRVALDDVVCPPYDVISPADREALLKRSEYGVVRLELPDTANEAAQLLHEWRRDGVLVRDAEPALWWHEQRFTGPDGIDRTRAGFFAAVRLSPYEEGRVRPHERTHAHAKQARLELMRATRANLSPIFGLYDDPEGGPRRGAGAGTAGDAPDMEATDGDGTVHRFWRVTSPDAIAAIQAAMAEREILIADGHHRYETALSYREEQRERDGNPADDRPYDFILMYLANLHGEGLAIYPDAPRRARAARRRRPVPVGVRVGGAAGRQLAVAGRGGAGRDPDRHHRVRGLAGRRAAGDGGPDPRCQRRDDGHAGDAQGGAGDRRRGAARRSCSRRCWGWTPSSS